MANWSSRVKYNKLPSADPDSVAIDFHSPFSFESAFKYSDGRHRPNHGYYMEDRDYNPPLIVHICTCMVTCLSFLLLILTFPISAWLCFKMVQQYERIVLFRLGRLQPAKGPGVIMVLPCIDKWRRVNMRTRAFNVPPQKVFTTDGAVISIGAVVHFQIDDVIASITAIQDLNHSTRILGQTSLLNLLSSKKYQEIETERISINQILQVELNTVTQNWGVTVTRVEISQTTLLAEPNPFAMGPLVMPPMQGFEMLQSAAKTVFSHLNNQQASLHAVAPANGQVPTETPPATMSPNDILSAVKLLLNDTLVKSIGAVYKFILTGNNGGSYYLDLKNGSGDAGEGDPIDEPDVVMEMSTYDMQRMFTGELRPFQAFLSGKLQVTGDRALAMKLDQVIKGLQESTC